MAVVVIILFSCQEKHTKKSSLVSLLHRVAVEEKEGSIIHHLPPYLQVLGDSLVCMKLSATNFTIYNYFTGQIQQRLSIDTGVLPQLLSDVQARINPKYTLITEQQSKEAGAPKTRIESVIYNEKKNEYLLFFLTAFCLDSPMVIKGKSEPFNWISNVPFMTTLDVRRNSTDQYVLLNYGTSSPDFSYTGLLFRNKLILPNYDPERAGTPGFGMLCSIDMADAAYTMRNLDLPFDERSLALQKQNRTQKMCFAAADSVSYYLAYGNSLQHSKNNIFRAVYRLDTGEYVYDIYVNRSRKLLYLNTLSWEENKQKGTRIFSLDLQTKVLKNLYSGSEPSAVKFINDSVLLKLSESPSQKHYAFEVYQY